MIDGSLVQGELSLTWSPSSSSPSSADATPSRFHSIMFTNHSLSHDAGLWLQTCKLCARIEGSRGHQWPEKRNNKIKSMLKGDMYKDNQLLWQKSFDSLPIFSLLLQSLPFYSTLQARWTQIMSCWRTNRSRNKWKSVLRKDKRYTSTFTTGLGKSELNFHPFSVQTIFVHLKIYILVSLMKIVSIFGESLYLCDQR